MNELEFMEKEISFFLGSPERRLMIDGCRYYKGEQDILRKQRTAIGEDGKPVVIHNIPNSRLEDNQYRKMVIQKTNYLVGKPITFRSDDAAYAKALKKVFNKAFAKKIKAVTKHSLNEGICWIYPTYGENGKLKFRVFPGYEVCPGWKDAEHSELEYAYRIYPIRLYEVLLTA
ncbi:MAG: phage portal protein [Firmicutes bacterium]|nr:phage portal protein [Bacillota bacterium]